MVSVHLIDAHCHPTEQVRSRAGHTVDIDAWIEEAGSVHLHKICVMSTDMWDQSLVARLADAYPNKIVPCFGIHPWAAHTISIQDPPPDRRTHYTNLFGPTQEEQAWLEALPTPVSLTQVLSLLEANLAKYPHALVGEIGMDRSFRIPIPQSSPRVLTKWQTPFEHQLAVLEAQLRVACQQRRSVSMHSVRAAGPTTALLERMCTYAGFNGISIDLHSCTLSPETIRQVQKTYKNVYVSFSTAVNGRQARLHEQIRACDPHRVLCESDWHGWDELAQRTNEIVSIMSTAWCTSSQAASLLPGLSSEELLGRLLTQNFERFSHMS